jgi:hypothetical protein
MILKQIYNFTIAIIQHIRYGAKKSSIYEIKHRYSICLSCEMMSKTNNQCLECGCYISNKKKFMNKLAWKDQKCPLGKW